MGTGAMVKSAYSEKVAAYARELFEIFRMVCFTGQKESLTLSQSTFMATM